MGTEVEKKQDERAGWWIPWAVLIGLGLLAYAHHTNQPPKVDMPPVITDPRLEREFENFVTSRQGELAQILGGRVEITCNVIPVGKGMGVGEAMVWGKEMVHLAFLREKGGWILLLDGGYVGAMDTEKTDQNKSLPPQTHEALKALFPSHVDRWKLGVPPTKP